VNPVVTVQSPDLGLLLHAVAHYQRFFNFTDAQDPVGSRSLGGLITLTDNDVDDIVAYLKLLGPNRIDK
jgi:hypothetical protein